MTPIFMSKPYFSGEGIANQAAFSTPENLHSPYNAANYVAINIPIKTAALDKIPFVQNF